MPSLDQALTESGLVAIAVLVFVLGFAGCSMCMGPRDGKDRNGDPGRPRPKDSSNPDDASNKKDDGKGEKKDEGKKDDDKKDSKKDADKDDQPNDGAKSDDDDDDDDPDGKKKHSRTYNVDLGNDHQISFDLPPGGGEFEVDIWQTPPPTPGGASGPGPEGAPTGVAPSNNGTSNPSDVSAGSSTTSEQQSSPPEQQSSPPQGQQSEGEGTQHQQQALFSPPPLLDALDGSSSALPGFSFLESPYGWPGTLPPMGPPIPPGGFSAPVSPLGRDMPMGERVRGEQGGGFGRLRAPPPLDIPSGELFGEGVHASPSPMGERSEFSLEQGVARPRGMRARSVDIPVPLDNLASPQDVHFGRGMGGRGQEKGGRLYERLRNPSEEVPVPIDQKGKIDEIIEKPVPPPASKQPLPGPPPAAKGKVDQTKEKLAPKGKEASRELPTAEKVKERSVEILGVPDMTPPSPIKLTVEPDELPVPADKPKLKMADVPDNKMPMPPPPLRKRRQVDEDITIKWPLKTKEEQLSPVSIAFSPEAKEIILPDPVEPPQKKALERPESQRKRVRPLKTKEEQLSPVSIALSPKAEEIILPDPVKPPQKKPLEQPEPQRKRVRLRGEDGRVIGSFDVKPGQKVVLDKSQVEASLVGKKQDIESPIEPEGKTVRLTGEAVKPTPDLGSKSELEQAKASLEIEIDRLEKQQQREDQRLSGESVSGNAKEDASELEERAEMRQQAENLHRQLERLREREKVSKLREENLKLEQLQDRLNDVSQRLEAPPRSHERERLRDDLGGAISPPRERLRERPDSLELDDPDEYDRRDREFDHYAERARGRQNSIEYAERQTQYDSAEETHSYYSGPDRRGYEREVEYQSYPDNGPIRRARGPTDRPMENSQRERYETEQMDQYDRHRPRSRVGRPAPEYVEKRVAPLRSGGRERRRAAPASYLSSYAETGVDHETPLGERRQERFDRHIDIVDRRGDTAGHSHTRSRVGRERMSNIGGSAIADEEYRPYRNRGQDISEAGSRQRPDFATSRPSGSRVRGDKRHEFSDLPEHDALKPARTSEVSRHADHQDEKRPVRFPEEFGKAGVGDGIRDDEIKPNESVSQAGSPNEPQESFEKPKSRSKVSHSQGGGEKAEPTERPLEHASAGEKKRERPILSPSKEHEEILRQRMEADSDDSPSPPPGNSDGASRVSRRSKAPAYSEVAGGRERADENEKRPSYFQVGEPGVDKGQIMETHKEGNPYHLADFTRETAPSARPAPQPNSRPQESLSTDKIQLKGTKSNVELLGSHAVDHLRDLQDIKSLDRPGKEAQERLSEKSGSEERVSNIPISEKLMLAAGSSQRANETAPSETMAEKGGRPVTLEQGDSGWRMSEAMSEKLRLEGRTAPPASLYRPSDFRMNHTGRKRKEDNSSQSPPTKRREENDYPADTKVQPQSKYHLQTKTGGDNRTHADEKRHRPPTQADLDRTQAILEEGGIVPPRGTTAVQAELTGRPPAYGADVQVYNATFGDSHFRPPTEPLPLRDFARSVNASGPEAQSTSEPHSVVDTGALRTGSVDTDDDTYNGDDRLKSRGDRPTRTPPHRGGHDEPPRPISPAPGFQRERKQPDFAENLPDDDASDSLTSKPIKGRKDRPAFEGDGEDDASTPDSEFEEVDLGQQTSRRSREEEEDTNRKAFQSRRRDAIRPPTQRRMHPEEEELDDEDSTNRRSSHDDDFRMLHRPPKGNDSGKESDFQMEGEESQDIADFWRVKTGKRAKSDEARIGEGRKPYSEGTDSPERRHDYPPRSRSPRSGFRSTRSDKTSSTDELEPLPPLSTVLSAKRAYRSLVLYLGNAKFLSAFFVLHMFATAAVSRQLSVLVMLSGSQGDGAGSSTGIAKRAPGDLPVDIKATQEWVVRTFGGVVNPDLAFVLLCSWLGLSILLLGYIYHCILASTENPPRAGEGEKENSWHKTKRLSGLAWKGLKRGCVGVARVIAMDRHPSLKNLRGRWGKWTVVRISVFLTQAILSTLVLRQTIALTSLVVGSANPIPSGPDITLFPKPLDNAASAMSDSPGTVFCFLLAILAGYIIILTWSWHSLLHPRKRDLRKKDPQQSRHSLLRLLTCRAFGTGIKLSSQQYKYVQLVIMAVLFIAFGSCLALISSIMNYASSVSWVKDAGKTNSAGVIVVFVLFGLFVLPMGWVLIKLDDFLLNPIMLRMRAGRHRTSRN